METPQDWIAEFVSCLDSADNRELQIEKAFTIKGQHLPKSLFKFRTVNAYSLDNLANGTVWISSPSAFNDHYDSAATISVAELMKAASKQYLLSESSRGLRAFLTAAELETALSSEEPMREAGRLVLPKDPGFPHERSEEYLDICSTTLENAVSSSVNALLAFMRDTLKICSFCAVNDRLAMWTHYAANNQGFCMEYEVSKLPDLLRRLLFPVIYSERLFDSTKYLVEPMTDRSRFNNIYGQVQALYKSPEWKYEQEWRLIFAGGVMKASNYQIGLPARVHLGSKMQVPDRDIVQAICGQRGIEVFQTTLDPNKYSVMSQRLHRVSGDFAGV
jgi:Protein of unknown function (DUF2971)